MKEVTVKVDDFVKVAIIKGREVKQYTIKVIEIKQGKIVGNEISYEVKNIDDMFKLEPSRTLEKRYGC